MDLDTAYIARVAPLLLRGAYVTLLISLAGIAAGILLGLVVALLRLSRHRVLAAVTGLYISFIRGTPFLVQAMVVFYVVPALLDTKVPALPAGIAALALNSAAFTGELLRAGIQSLPRGQSEAARALGLPAGRTLRRIILPQVFRILLPALTNEFTVLVKGSSILSVITVVELTRVGQQLVNTEYRPVETYLVVALLYFVINFGINRAATALQRRTGAGLQGAAGW
ncbi:MAG TPA: amino acid ABC transporter permease [Bacillota bacterium]